jgi:2-amino-4-hydroxy-6-hydroxymethyldihydropteridine diphosphokinase
MKAVLGLGTNMGYRAENIKSATESLALVPGIKILRESPVYETTPWGITEQRNFYNNVIEIETELTPNALLGVCLGIEAAMGRVRTLKNGSRHQRHLKDMA